jgi:DNA-directed RNA polymerase specialized sigma24 family protein
MTFDQAYRTNHRSLVRHADRLCAGVAYKIDPEDVVQEGATRAWLNWNARESLSEKGWLFLMLRQAFHALMREAYAGKRGHGASHVEFNPEIHDAVADPVQEFVVDLARLREKFSALGPVQAETMLLTSYGLTGDEIAEFTGRSAPGVRMALSAGRRQMRKIFGDEM